jgi:hypothetical protein
MANNFSDLDHVVLARGIFIRWNKDLAAAAVAWRRLFQNNCTDNDFKKLLDNAEHTTFCQGQCSHLCQG